ncbi:hypothetical protein IWZ00DRAFT_60909 [Phyllosticta capitalensis]
MALQCQRVSESVWHASTPEKPSMMADGIKRVTTVFLSKLSSVARAPSQGTLTHTQGHPEALLGGGGLLMQAIMERLRRKSWFLPHAEEAVLGVAQWVVTFKSPSWRRQVERWFYLWTCRPVPAPASHCEQNPTEPRTSHKSSLLLSLPCPPNQLKHSLWLSAVTLVSLASKPPSPDILTYLPYLVFQNLLWASSGFTPHPATC